MLVERNGADGALLVAAMIFGGVGILAATEPGFAFGGRNEGFRVAKGNAVRAGEILRALGDEHHVGASFQDRAGGLDRIFDAAQAGDGAGTEGGGVHDDGVAFHVAVEGEVRAISRVEKGIVLEDDDGGFDRVERVAAVFEDSPAGLESAEAAGFTGVDGVIGDIPGAAVNDERRLHRDAG